MGVGIHRGSTIVFKNAAAYAARGDRGDDGYSYGLYGTPTTRTLETKITDLENGVRSFLAPSGQAANALAMLPFLSSGDHILLADTVYPPMRDLACNDLSRMGVAVDFFDPTDLNSLADMMRPETRIVWCESPGSTTMEIMDLPAAADIAHAGGALLGVDNTWATPLNLKPLNLGADLVTEALTKYISGHSDVLMGSISVRDPRHIAPIKGYIGRMGIGASPDDAALVLRGFETFALRLRHSASVATRFAQQLTNHPLIKEVLFPALPSFAGHAIFNRDFTGSSGVFSLTFSDHIAPHVAPALDALDLFSIGASWGGTRSLVAPMPVRTSRSATRWPHADIALRVSIGLEDEAELWTDFERFLNALQNAAG
ncbi:PLP-dependent transferase [Rhodobacteraceae bacterium D3-12]|nr:PLP-dependent transferase [Rhodobacteraceae bacterium D3-12]